MNKSERETPGKRPAYNDLGTQIGTWYSGKLMDDLLNRHWETHEEKQVLREAARDAKRHQPEYFNTDNSRDIQVFPKPTRSAPASGSNRGSRGKKRNGRT